MRRISTTPGALAIAAALMMILTACTNADNLGGAPEQPGAGAQPTTVRVTVGAGFADDGDAQTRSADDAMTRSAVTQSGTARTLTFTAGDKLYVNAHIDEEGRYLLAGFLALDASSLGADGKSASFTGDLSVYDCDDYPPVAATYDFGGATDPLAVCADASAWLVHEGTEADFTVYDSKWGQYDRVPYTHTVMADVSALMTTRLSVRTWGSYDAGARRFGLTASEEAILNCTLGGLTGGQTYSVALETTMTSPFYFSDSETYTGSVTADAGGTARFAILCDAVEGNSYRILLTSVADADDVVTFDLGQRDLSAKVYNVERNAARIVDLSTVASGFTAQEGDVLTGTLGSRVKISIADGATVTLRDATIPGDNNLYYQWAGLTCEGDATIRLEGANSVQGYYPEFPGILIPKGKTLTIDGSGSLTAVSGYFSDDHIGVGAGIGGRERTDCGQIVINGGTITANGGMGASGIGCGRSDINVQASCDGITINGGTVTANGGTNAAGIGNGNMGNCGDITISGGTVTATGGDNAPYSIGMGRSGGTCGPVTIGGLAVANVVGSPYTYTGGDIASGTVTFSPRFSNWPDGMSMSINEITHVGAASIVISDGTYAYPGVMTSAGAPSTVAAAPLSATVATGTGRTLTFTATGVTYEYSYMSQTGSFSGTFTGDITDGVSIGQVWMAKQ